MRSLLKPNPERMRLKGDLNGLIRLIRNNKDEQVRREAIHALGRMQTPVAVPYLIELFQDPEYGIRNTASDALVHIGHDAIEPLIATLSMADEPTARMVHATLTGIGEDAAKEIIRHIPDLQGIGFERAGYILYSMGNRVIPVLIDSLATSDQTTIRFVEGILETFGRSALHQLIEALSHEREEVRARVAALLVILGDQVVPDLLSSCAQDDEPVRDLKFYIISEIGDPALESLYQSLKDPNPITSSMAQKAFLEFGESAIVPLISGLYEQDPDVRQVSENALNRIGEPIVPHLIQEIPFHKEQDREPLIAVIIRIGEPAIPHLIQALATGQGEIPRSIIQILPRMGAITIPYLLSSVKDQANTSSIQEVFLSMGRIAFPFLEEAAERESGKTALFAINILRKIDPVRAVEPLTGALYHPEQQVRETALENLVEIGEMAIPRLVQVLGSGNEEAVELARLALVRNGDAAVPHLVDALGDTMIGDPDMILDILRQAGTDALPYLIPAMATTKEGHEQAMMLVREQGSEATPYLLEAYPGATPDLAHPIKTLLRECFVQDPGGFVTRMFSGQNLDTDFIFELIGSSPGMVIHHLIGVVQGDDEKKALAAGELLARFRTNAIDPLMNLLRTETDEDRRLVITSFLIKIGPDAIPSLISAMTEPGLAPYAMAALGAIGEPAVPALLPLLKSHDTQVLQYAILALTRIGSPAASALMALMQEDETLVPLISRILAEMGGAALPELLAEMQTLKEEGQEGSNRGIALMSMITEIALSGRDDMQYLFRIEDPLLRGMLERVFIIKGEVILGPVIDAVLNEKAVPEMAATIFTSFRPQTLAAATRMIQEIPEGDTRRVPLLQILGLLKDPGSASLIYESLHDHNHEIRLCAVRQLGKFGREALDPLTEAMNDPDTEVRAAAVDSLGHIGLPVLDQLITALKDKDGPIRTAAINGIARIGEPGQFMLIQSLDDPDRQVRQAVARLLDQSNWKPKYTTDKISYLFAREDFASLVKIGPPSLDILAKGLHDDDPGIQEKSREALEAIRSSIQAEHKKT